MASFAPPGYAYASGSRAIGSRPLI